MTARAKSSATVHLLWSYLRCANNNCNRLVCSELVIKEQLPFYTIIMVVFKHLIIIKMKGDYLLVISQGHRSWNDLVFLKGAPKVSYPLQYFCDKSGQWACEAQGSIMPSNENPAGWAELCWEIGTPSLPPQPPAEPISPEGHPSHRTARSGINRGLRNCSLASSSSQKVQ